MSKYKNPNLQQVAAVFKALSNPHRLQIFLGLVTCCKPGTVCETEAGAVPVCVGEIGRQIAIAASTLSHHLKSLRQVGLIRMERQGQKFACWVDPDILRQLSFFFNELESGATVESADYAKINKNDRAIGG